MFLIKIERLLDDYRLFLLLVWITLSRIINQYHRIRYIAKYHNASFYPCNGPLGKEQPEQPEQNAGTYQCEQVEVCNSAKMEGVILALHPNTKKILKRLLPITFPIAISGFFFSAATMEVASSGREVPPATSVNPIMDSLTPMLRAIPVAPLTNS